MISSLVPGFRSHGSPVKQLAAEERAPERQVRDDYDEGYQDAMRGDPRIRRPYTPDEMAEMGSIRSPKYPGEDPEHHHSVLGARDAGTRGRGGAFRNHRARRGELVDHPAAGDLVAVSYNPGYGVEAMVGFDAL